MRRVVGIVLGLGVVAAACGGGEGLPFVSGGGLEADHARYEDVAAREIAIFESGDFEAERELYVPDIVIVDGDGSAEGIDELVWIATFIASQFPDYSLAHTATYTGLDDGIVVMDQWGWEGFTDDDRVHEYRIIEVVDGVITAWEAVYTMDARPYFGDRGGADEEALALRDRYLAAWGAGDAAALAALYSDDAVRGDPLFGVRAEGRAAIEEQASDLLGRVPGLSYELLDTIGLRSHERVDVGAVVEITWDADPACAVAAVVWLESDAGLITRERAYYDVPSLVACGWVGP